MVDYRKLKIVVFTDDRPGHEKQSLGIVRALESQTVVETINIHVKKTGAVKNFINILNFFLGIYSCRDNRFVDVDLFLGTGRHTHIPLLIAQKMYGGRAVCCMTPGLLLRSKFDLCFVPSHDSVKQNKNIVYTLGAPNGLCDHKRHNQEIGLVLIGGVSPKQRWSTQRTLQHVQKLLELFPEKSWRVSSSPRTPNETVVALKNLAKQSKKIEFFHYKDTESGWVEEEYHFCQEVWVTADSISMVFEALSAGCKVGLLSVDWKSATSKFQQNEKYLIENNFVATLEQQIHSSKECRIQKSFNEASKCALLMLEKWWRKEHL